MTPKIIFEDPEFLVIDKPSGMIVHPDLKHDYPALDAWLRQKYGDIFLVHRIDRETSGVLIVARTPECQEFLKQQFQSREVKKTYRAFVYGTFKDERGIIDKPIGSARGGLGPRSAKNPYGKEREALTTYKVLKNATGVAYVEVFPKTGRTHQIRVHFASIGHPVVCDTLYAAGRPAELQFDRLALHALSLSFTNRYGEEQTFTAPLPKDFLAAEQKIR